MSLLCLVKYLGQFNVTSYILHNAGSAQCHRHVTENEPKNNWRSLEAGIYWHLFVQVHNESDTHHGIMLYFTCLANAGVIAKFAVSHTLILC